MQQWYFAISAQIDQVDKRIHMQKTNEAIVEKEVEKSNMDASVVHKLIIPKAVMFDPLQQSMLIGYFTGRDIFLNKLIPLLSVYLDRCRACRALVQAHEKPNA